MSIPLNALIVEDNPDDALILVRELRKAGYDVTDEIVETAQGLKKALESKAWDLVLADYSLPGFNGLDALKIVQAHDPDLPFLLISGTITEEIASVILRSGAHDFFVKGNWARLVPAVERELREAENRRKKRQAEEALRESEKKHRTLLENLPQKIFFKDRNSVYVACNGNYARDLKIPSDEIQGRTDYDFFPRDLAEKYRSDDRRVLESGRTEELEERYLQEGQERWVHTVKIPVKDEAGVGIGVLGIFRDTTERKHLEEQYLQAQKLESVGRLAGGVAHDFNNLLTVILGYCDVVLTALPENDPLRPRMEEIQIAGERAASLAAQLLAFSRKQIVQPEVLCLNAVVERMTRILQRVIGEDIELTTELDPDLGRVRMDPVQVEQVLMNLAVNSRDAMPRGGRLRIATRNLGNPPGLPPGRYSAFEVKDTGCGMDRETQERIFEPFFTTKEKSKGTGLGLSTVYGIVQQNGGDIRVESEPGRGTTFTVRLPTVTEALEERTPAAKPREARGGRETVLVVEDDEVIRSLIREVLEGSGYTVLEADRGAEALRLSEKKEGPIQLLIADVVMPGISGPEVAGHLARYRPEMKVLYISGYTDDKVGRHGIQDSGAAFLQKPFRIEALTRKVREVLDAP